MTKSQSVPASCRLCFDARREQRVHHSLISIQCLDSNLASIVEASPPTNTISAKMTKALSSLISLVQSAWASSWETSPPHRLPTTCYLAVSPQFPLIAGFDLYVSLLESTPPLEMT